jgi:hypothetical protein
LDIAYYLLSQPLSIDWYCYYQFLTLLGCEVATDTTTEAREGTDSSPVRSRASSSIPPPPSLSLHHHSPKFRRNSRVDQWFDIINPELDDNGYQYVAIVSRDQCNEVS